MSEIDLFFYIICSAPLHLRGKSSRNRMNTLAKTSGRTSFLSIFHIFLITVNVIINVILRDQVQEKSRKLN